MTGYISTKNKELNGIIQKLHNIDPTGITKKSNLDRNEQAAYNQLKALSKSSIEIKKADKSDT